MTLATTSLRVRLPLWRARLLVILLLLWFVALLVRALYLQVLNNDFLREKGDARYSRVIELSAHRGMITDRHGDPLAISTPVESIWASPQDVELKPGKARELAKLLSVSNAEIEKNLADVNKEFVYLKRGLSPEQAKKVMDLAIPGVFLQRGYRRYYPAGEVTAHILGFTNVDDIGQEGVELTYQNWLAGQTGSRRVIKDRVGHIIEDVESVKTPQEGRNLTLSIDRRIQYLAYRELKAAVEANKAKAGAIVVLDARSGEILALANLPTYNPNNRAKLDRNSTRNRSITDIFEPGSTMKPITVAAALETGKFKPSSMIDTAPGRFSIGAATIHDAHPNGMLSVAQVIQKSSNVGAAKIALTLEPEYLSQTFTKLGFGQLPHSGFPGEASGKVRPYKTWRPIEQATMSYGHGISVSVLQLARAYTVFASAGELKPLSLVKLEDDPAGERVFSPSTAKEVRTMLEMAVQPGGTALKANTVGYRVAGKTGTAHKQENHGYAANRYIASFVGFAPASAPRLVIAVMVDEPNAGQYYGGAVAAPVFSSVMGGALRMLSVPPDAPTNNTLLPNDVSDVQEEV
ncbi:MAG: penicillin-binding protein 2 [Sulfuricellaceae bacterium]|nr:penicillin-binding protein 2 [Sulfuricellaceae bacterium]